MPFRGSGNLWGRMVFQTILGILPLGWLQPLAQFFRRSTVVRYFLGEVNSQKAENLLAIYAESEVIGRNHKKYFHWDLSSDNSIKARFYYLSPGCLGAEEITSGLTRNLCELKKLDKYFTEYDSLSHIHEFSLCRINRRLGSPYLSGISGMCNAFYSTFPLLGIQYRSYCGTRLAEIMSAFVVAIGFHSFQECCNGFYIAHHYFDNPDQLVVDFELGDGPFSPVTD